MDSDIKWKNIQRILTRTKKSSKIKVQSKKEKKRGETQMAVERESLSFLRAKYELIYFDNNKATNRKHEEEKK